MDPPDPSEGPQHSHLQADDDNNRTTGSRPLQDFVDLTTGTGTEEQLRKHNRDDDGNPSLSSKRKKFENERSGSDESTLQKIWVLREELDELKFEKKRLSLLCDRRHQDLQSVQTLLDQERQAKATHEQQLDTEQKEREIAIQSQKSAEAECIELQARLDEQSTRIQEAEGLLESYEGVNGHLTKKKDDLEKKLTKLRGEMKDLRKSKKEADQEREQEKARLNAQVEGLRTTLKTRKKEWNETKDKLLEELQKSQGLNQRHNFKISDEEIKEKWGNLKHMIGQFVDKYASNPTTFDEDDKYASNPTTFDENDKFFHSWKTLSLKFKMVLANKHLCHFAWEAYIWQWLDFTVFDETSKVWAGDIGEALTQVMLLATKQLRGPKDELYQEYHSWRSMSSNFLSRLNQRTHNHESSSRDVNALIQSLLRLQPSIELQKEDAMDKAMIILHEARSFDTMRRKLRANVRVHFRWCGNHSEPRKFQIAKDDKYMKDLSIPIYCAGNDQPMVDLIISPSVVRCGNSEGVDYDREHCLIPMDVLCDISIPAQQHQIYHPEVMGQRESRSRSPTLEIDSKAGGNAAAHNQHTMDQSESAKSTMEDEDHGSASAPPARPIRSSKRTCVLKAHGARTQVDEEQDELAGGANEDSDSSAPASQRRRGRHEDDEAYVATDGEA